MITGGMWIYFFRPIGQSGPIKIGCSRKPARRLDYLAAWSPFPLECIGEVLGDIVYERAIQRRFAHLCLHKEWFSPGPDLLDFIAHAITLKRIDDAYRIEDRAICPVAFLEAAQ